MSIIVSHFKLGISSVYEKNIIIIRDPLKAALAEYNRKHSTKLNKEQSHTGHIPIDDFKGAYFNNNFLVEHHVP